MDTKEQSKNWWAGIKRWKYLLIMVVCVSILLITPIFVLISADKNNEARYRSENYERFKENLVSFSEMIANTDALCEDLKLTEYILPAFVKSSDDDLRAQLLERGTGIIEGRGLFTYDTTGYKMLSRLHSMAMINQAFQSWRSTIRKPAYPLSSPATADWARLPASRIDEGMRSL